MSSSSAPAAATTTENGPHPLWYRLRRAQNWLFLGLTYASYYLCRYNLSTVSPEFKESLGFSNADYGAIKGSRDAAYGIGQFFNGLLADRMGGKQAMTLGAIGTVLLNLLFGLTAWKNFGYLFLALAIIRGLDGYVQAFGAPGWVKINAAWFRREERGGFAGIFGGMIQLGAISVGRLWTVISAGFAVPLLFFTFTVKPLDWRYMFIIPPAILLVFTLLMNLTVKNHPEEVGYRVRHDDEAGDDDPHTAAKFGDVFRKIVTNPIVWIVSCAYMCTGFVRSGVETWWAIYLKEIWHADKSSWMFAILVTALPLSAFLGSLASGWVSDKLGRGRRAPVAATLYGLEAAMIIIALAMSATSSIAPTSALVVLIALNLTCNSTHSILGTAAAMDLGGRKATGFALGVINSFQYLGQVQAAFGIGALIDLFGKQPAAIGTAAAATQAAKSVVFTPTVWFTTMLPYALLGMVLMLYLTIRHAKTGARGT